MLRSESSWHGRSVDHVITICHRQIAVGNRMKPSRITRQKTCCRQVSQTRRFALYSRTGVVLMRPLESSWHGERGSFLNIFRYEKSAGGPQKSLHELRGTDLLSK
ncbi:uncharacterized protein G2W53_009814 [Senna tora]|uniref:Uncharacterized protein n=1 Tax=Senna tora TaxID=362788 RepID=A0A834WZ83_9FABA|nr:uncharacterized protein G2W53_009814 [Senna tora]